MGIFLTQNPFLSHSPSSHGEALGTRRKLYSAVPGRHFVVVRPYSVQAEGEINLYKGDRVKGEAGNILSWCGGGIICFFISDRLTKVKELISTNVSVSQQICH